MRDHTRDYATEAFRHYARCGGLEGYLETLKDSISTTGEGGGSSLFNPTEAEVIRLEEEKQKREAEILDLEAVSNVLKILDVSNKRCIINAVKGVYFEDADKELSKGDMHRRVCKVSLQIPACEMTIYRWLKQARVLFAKERKLRC